MASLPRDEERRLRRILKIALGAAIAAGQVALPFACSDGESGSGGSTTRTKADPTTSAGGDDQRDAGPDPVRDAKTCDPAVFIPDGAHDCEKFVHLGCGLPPDAAVYAGCYLLVSQCTSICAGPAFNCRVSGSACDDGSVPDLAPADGIDLECAVCLGDDGSVGRVPAGLRRRRSVVTRAGERLARAAELEAASVFAFRRLADELAAHGAPVSLVRAAERAAVDEGRHARTVARLARREGAAPKRPRIRKPRPRSLEAIAIENAVEGKVRETFGALVASFQAERAQGAEVREAYATIAVEETRHAALASRVHRWAMKRLGPGARRRVDAAELGALAALGREPTPAGAAILGLPSPAEHRQLLRAFLDARA